ncbi:hypothetical protein GV054_09070 [Marinomonas mediterranea]|uniref:hypothetical protein n=1 Tax=Marinomonas mediterranea TaxID=119864 RepID=UPI00234BD866|nr:hypothetical protein [Marinomonas mediterranea]WCN13145.1 hypothetical protein GV054_09070 [Marinomonas mediterranea]
MLKFIKQTYNDLTEFFLLLFTGVFAGSIFTLAYIKFWQEGDVTFADIGGMLAGVGTIGLLSVAIKTTNAWKNQSYHEQKINSLDDFYSKIDGFYLQSEKIIMLLAVPAMNEPSEKGAPTNIKDPTVYINEIDKLLNLRSSVQSSLIRLNAVWSTEITSNIFPSLSAMSRMRESLQFGQSIFFTHNKAMTKHFDQHEMARVEIDKLYKQLNQ